MDRAFLPAYVRRFLNGRDRGVSGDFCGRSFCEYGAWMMSGEDAAGWNDEKIGRLKKLWSEGLTTGEIGKRLGVSKNAVVGKAHRLGLKGRPSPIKRPTRAAP